MSRPCTTSSWGTIPIRLRNDAYSACRSLPSNDTVPLVGWAEPTITRESVDLPEPDGPITAVNVPGRASNEILSSRTISRSIARLTSRTSRPPVVVAGMGATHQSPVGEYEVDVADRHDVVFAEVPFG